MQAGNTSPFIEFNISSKWSQAGSIVAGADKLWFSEASLNNIASIDMNGAIVEYAIPTQASEPTGMYVDKVSGDVWFAERNASRIGRLHAGTITEFATPTAGSAPFGITKGPDGNFWFTESTANKIGTITPQGAITEQSITADPDTGPGRIVTAADGRMWFAEATRSAIGSITVAGAQTYHVVGHSPVEIAAGSANSLVFTDPTTGSLGQMSSPDVARIFSTGNGTQPMGLAGTPDGKVWFTDSSANTIRSVRLTSTGAKFIDALNVPTAAGKPTSIAMGPDGNLWFTEEASNKIGVYRYNKQIATPSSIAFTAVGQTQNFTASESGYGGSFTATASNPAVARVVSSGPNAFTVSAIGSGTASVSISDSAKRTTAIAIGVTTTVLELR
ncbi:MAG: hypothetical protein NVS3B28_26470 [Candidatus Velthaea sp.]